VVGRINTRYWLLGERGPALLLLHGLGGSAEDWLFNAHPLAAGNRVYVPDLVGCGQTDKPAMRHSLPCFAQFVAEFMTTVGVERASLVGHSLGGAVALQFALLYPDRLTSLVIVNSAGLGREVALSSRLATVPLLGELLTRPSRFAVRQFMERVVFDRAMITEEAVSIVLKRSSLPGAQRSTLAIIRALVTLRGAKEEAVGPIVGNLRRIPAPTLIIWGRHDRLLPVAHAEVAAQAIPEAALRIFEACGHAPQYERADEFNAFVLEFLRARCAAA
jgi:pimeloyl-ACP methyl ester carboxylesterase